MGDFLTKSAAFIGAFSTLWFTVSLIRIIPKNSRPSALIGLKKSSLTFLASLVLPFIGVIIDPSTDTFLTRKDRPVAAASVRSKADELSERQKREDKISSYIDLIKSETPLVATFNAREHGDSIKSIMMGLALLNVWVGIYDEGASLNLPADKEAIRQSFKKSISKKQAEAFPVLRDLFGPAMRKQLWEADGKARTFGKGFRTIDLISAAFAANRNIKTIHEELYPSLMMLRFTRAQYKWLDANVEYSYYPLKPPSDSALVVWNKNGSYRKID